MKRLYRKLKVSPVWSRRYMLDEDYTVRGWLVPKGFLTNGANVPKISYPALPPNDPLVFPAVVCHDYLCDVVKTKINEGHEIDAIRSFKLANQEFNEIMKYLEISTFRRATYYIGVSVHTSVIRPIVLFYYRKTGKKLPVYKRNAELISKQIELGIV